MGADEMNKAAENAQRTYTIASRCGVFAKTDIQPLINEGATKADLAASIFQAVVNQTISGLACGKPIRGHVAFLGGPLHFLPQLKAAFIRTLKILISSPPPARPSTKRPPRRSRSARSSSVSTAACRWILN